MGPSLSRKAGGCTGCPAAPPALTSARDAGSGGHNAGSRPGDPSDLFARDASDSDARPKR